MRYGIAISTGRSRIAIAVAGLIVVALALAPVMAPRSLIQDLILIFVMCAIAQCWNLLAGYAGLISVGQQAFVGLGGYALFALIILLGIDPLLAVLIAAIIGTLIAVPVGLLMFRLQGAYFAVGTWVVAEVFRLLLAQWKALGGGTGNSLPRTATTEMFGLGAVNAFFGVRNAVGREIIIYWVALALAFAVVGASYLLLRSRIGLALSAVRDGEEAAESVGVDITRTKFIVYLFAALGASLAGALYFLDNARISPDSAFTVLDWTAYVIFIVVIGGIGTIEGPILGSIIFVVLQSSLSSYGPWYLLLLGALGIAVMLVAPRGLYGTFSDLTGIHLLPTRRRLVPLGETPPTREA
jgi:branched-chain amino acid transport system permease protein